MPLMIRCARLPEYFLAGMFHPDVVPSSALMSVLSSGAHSTRLSDGLMRRGRGRDLTRWLRNRNVSLSRLPSKPVRHDETQLSSCSPARLYEPAQHNRCRFLLPRLQLAALAHADNDAISAPPCQRRQPLGIGPSGKLPHPAPLRASSQNHTHAKVSSMSVPASGFLRLARKRRVFLFGGLGIR